jgi:hypothetical protein
MSASAGQNTLTGLIPVIYEAMDVIPRELVGAIQAVQLDPSAEMAGLNQTIRSPIVPVATAVDVVPGVTNTNGSGQTISFADLLISKVKNSPILWSGEEQLLLKAEYAGIVKRQFQQSFRTLGNLIEADVVNAAALGSCRTVGTAGTTPFGTAGVLSDFANSVKMLDDNGAPALDRSIILGTAAAANIRGVQSTLFKVNEAGSAELLRTGALGTVEGLDVRTSGQIKNGQGQNGIAVGTGAAYVLNGVHAAGATSVTVKTGTGTVLVGDVVKITSGGVATSYVATSSIAAPGTFTIASPGLVQAGADSDTVTVVAASQKNVFLQKAGFLLATRLPAMPQGGDAASDMIVVTDPVTGLSFQIAMYKQYRQITIDIAIAWGTKVLRSDYVGLLLG